VQNLRTGHVRPGLQGRPVRLLRVPVPDEAGQRGLRLSQAERKALRGDGGGEDSGERAHRVQHQGTGQAGGRGDGRYRPGAAPEAGDCRGGTGRREAQAGAALQPSGDHRPGHRGLQAPNPGPPGTAAEAGGNGGGVQSVAIPAKGCSGRRGDHHCLLRGPEQVSERKRAHRAAGLHRVLRQGDRGAARRRVGALLNPHARR